MREYCESGENTARTQGKSSLQDRSCALAYLIPRELSIDLDSTGTAICNITVEVYRACMHMLYVEQKLTLCSVYGTFSKTHTET